MRTLLLLRHAKSSWKQPDLDDHDRPLNGRGKRDAPRMGRLLASARLEPDLIVCSTALRARRTVERVVDAADCDAPIAFTESLYHAEPGEILDVLRNVPPYAGVVMLVGHNPGLESFLAMLSGCYESLPTAALCHLEVDIDEWAKITPATTARLVDVYRPRDLPS